MDAPRPRSLQDAHGRTISYLRISVTDRCEFRCRYCMPQVMSFLPRRELLSFEELSAVADRFVARGIRRIRLTGGEPLARRGLPDLAARMGQNLGRGLDELTLTTNGTRLVEHAAALRDAGVRRINVSLDTLDPDRFAYIARSQQLPDVLAGLNAARAAGLHVKINMVALKGLNEVDIDPMMRWCADQGFDLSLIETMPLGHIDDDGENRFLPLTEVRARLADRYTLMPSEMRTGGPSRYWQVTELGLTLGLISPLTENFCAGCNRIRLTAEGKLFMCLGHSDQVDVKAALRDGGVDALDAILDQALSTKPLAHDFGVDRARPAVSRHMSVTGG